MTKPDSFQIEQAKEFLKNRILAEAAEENVSLSPAEIATLMYSEPAATPAEREAADRVDAEIGSDEYERKVTKLIRHAYKRDVKAGRKREWTQFLRALRHEDLYVLVMVRSADLPGSPAWYELFSLFLRFDTLCIAAVAVAGLVVLFTPIGSFLRSNLLRATLFALWIATMWGLGEWSKRRGFRTGK